VVYSGTVKSEPLFLESKVRNRTKCISIFLRPTFVLRKFETEVATRGVGGIIDLLKARRIPLQGTVTLRRTCTPERS